jgi:hypothetical protein
MSVFFFVFEGVLGHAFPAYDVMLVQYLSIQHGFAENDGDDQEAEQDDSVGDEFF